MATFSTSFSFFIVFLFLTHSAQAHPPQHPFCPPPPPCEYINEIRFPFSSTSNPKCGLQTISCNGFEATIQFGRLYAILNIWYPENKLIILDSNVRDMLYSDNHSQIQFDVCNSLYNFTTPTSTSDFLSFRLETPMYTFLKCKRSQNQMPLNHGLFNYTDCKNHDLFYNDNKTVQNIHHNCSVIHFPLSQSFHWNPQNLIELLSRGIILSWNINQDCENCFWGGGLCTQNGSKGNLTCSGLTNKKGRHRIQITIGISAGIGGFLLSCLFFIIFRQWRNRRLHPASSILLPRVFSSFPYSKPELGKASNLFNTQIFTYAELEEATDNFNPIRKLGCGGFGTVYHGKLRDGRFVAVKRLYENSYKQMEQFRNEIGILSRLRHQNLVTLYGCGSRHSHELLLVYEFIPNGTVADHLHCNRAKPGVLTWPIRLSIAIETADALAYLHNVEIIHRDVKTNNILLDDDFHVKVADFGLSRLFSFEASHVSTAPQGTPGYVDPNYHRYYQLTDKSDVYSFGVVLIELISSMPAVDVTRHQHEINLANMAINKIQNDALPELVDPALGFDSNFAVRRMITLVAELAFRCLQDQREVRPSMEEVLQVLREIRREADEVVKIEDGSTTAEDAALLKQAPAASPDTMTDAWVSRSGTNDINELYIHSLD